MCKPVGSGQHSSLSKNVLRIVSVNIVAPQSRKQHKPCPVLGYQDVDVVGEFSPGTPWVMVSTLAIGRPDLAWVENVRSV